MMTLGPVGDGFDDNDALDEMDVYDDSLLGAARFAMAVLHAEIMEQGRPFENSAKLRYTAWKQLRVAILHEDLANRPATTP